MLAAFLLGKFLPLLQNCCRLSPLHQPSSYIPFRINFLSLDMLVQSLFPPRTRLLSIFHYMYLTLSVPVSGVLITSTSYTLSLVYMQLHEEFVTILTSARMATVGRIGDGDV